MENFFDYCRNYVLDELPNYEGRTEYACDFGVTMTEGMCCDGTITYSTAKAIDYIKEWWYDCADFSDYEKFNFGERSNPFENPERFLATMVSEGVRTLLSKSNYIERHWNKKIKLDKKTLRVIRRQVGSITNCDLF